MKITVLGGTGRTGSEFIQLAVRDGHMITALVRDKEKAAGLWPVSPNIHLIEGDVLNPESIASSIPADTEAVFSALSTDKQQTLSRSIPSIIEEMTRHRVNYFAAIGTAGILDARHEEGKYRFESDESKRRSTTAAEDHLKVYEHLSGSSLNWILFCPTYLPDGPARSPVVWEKNRLPENVKQITVGNTAKFVYAHFFEPEFNRFRIGIGERPSDTSLQ